MKKIGFLDYFLSEWHANNYPAWIAEESAKRGGEEYRVAYAYAEIDRSPYDGVTTDEWCEKQGVTRAASIAELCEKSDVIVILSPDNPENHLRYAEQVFPYGKPVYMDKTFAPDVETADAILALAARYNVPLFSSSALRFASELDGYRRAATGADSAVAVGPNSVEIYAVHICETLNVVMKNGAKRVMALTTGKNRTAVFDYGDGRRAVYCQMETRNGPAFLVSVERDGENVAQQIASPMFRYFIAEMLTFFADGTRPVTTEETREVMRMIAALRRALAEPDVWQAV